MQLGGSADSAVVSFLSFEQAGAPMGQYPTHPPLDAAKLWRKCILACLRAPGTGYMRK